MAESDLEKPAGAIDIALKERRKLHENDAMVSRHRVVIINANYLGLLEGLPHNCIERK